MPPDEPRHTRLRILEVGELGGARAPHVVGGERRAGPRAEVHEQVAQAVLLVGGQAVAGVVDQQRARVYFSWSVLTVEN